MFYEIDHFPFLKTLVDKVDLFSKEFEQQKKQPLLADFLNASLPELNSHTHYWIKEGGFDSTQIGYDARDGSWASFPLFKKGFPIKWYDVEKSFPETYKHILSVPEVNFASFFRLAPDSGTKEHVHTVSNFIFHLCLSDPDGESVLKCDGHEKIFQKKGDYALFDYSKPHSSFNSGKKDRINLVVDFSSAIR
jgi:aspartyl/asparaginyl beta-hydroxylase (cupin superfamily)